ncbi:MAG: serine/threonine protein phosphatase [Clostridiales bacterium]|nr:serine/threonine protein phosphatase [Clostridiales bacterium]
MSLFVLSDTHLSESVQKPMDIFGARWLHYTEKLKENWLQTVQPADTVIIPGDISWAMTLAEAEQDLMLLGSLPGQKILCRGNHDYFWTSLSKMKSFLLEKGIAHMDFLQNNAIACENIIITGTRGWYASAADAPDGADFDKITARELLRFDMSLQEAEKLQAQSESEYEWIAVFHFPPLMGDYVNHDIIRLLKKYHIKRVYFGHIHGLYHLPPVTTFDGISFHLVSADYLNFYPLKIN